MLREKNRRHRGTFRADREYSPAQGGLSEAETDIRAALARLEEAAQSDKPLSPEELSALRRQLEDSSLSLREQSERSKQVHEENAHLAKRRDELEQRLATLEQEYEELLGASCQRPRVTSSC